MPQEPLPMRQIDTVLRLHHQQNLSIRQIAHSLGLKRSTVSDYLKRAAAAGLGWPLPEELSEQDLHRTLLGLPSSRSGRPLPDWVYVHCELRKKSVTLQLLHEEYLVQYEDGYRYTQFCGLYRQFRKSLNVCLRQTYQAGEKLFVDSDGQPLGIVARANTKSKAHLFVAVLGASNYTYVEATATEALEDWIQAHVNAFEYFGGVSALTIPDNTKCAVVKPCRYEPELNPTYLDLATHYGTCIMPTRVARPKDKAKVETGVLIVERWILAVLRKRTFFSLPELNLAIRELLEHLNNRPFKKLPGCRYSLFTQLDKPALLPLPKDRYEYAEWDRATVNIDYHVAVYLGNRHYHYYSVPYTLVNRKLDLRLSRNTVEAYFKGQRVASHIRSNRPGKHTTLSEHMPEAHKRHLQWTPSRILNWAAKTGPACRETIQAIMDDRPHPEQGYRSCLGIIRLGDRYGKERLEAACKRALTLHLISYKSIDNMLKTNQDKLPLPGEEQQPLPVNKNTHVRGSVYYR